MCDVDNRGFYDVFIPSLNGYFSFYEITTAQQMALAKTMIAEPGPYKTEFVKCIIKTLNQNNVDKICIESLNIVDGLCIMLALKCASISPDVALTVTCKNCKSKHNAKLVLDKIYDDLLKIEFNSAEIEGYRFGLPTLEDELNSMYAIKKYANLENNYKEMAILNVLRFVQNRKGFGFDINMFDEVELEQFEKMLSHITKLNQHVSTIEIYDINCMGKMCKTKLSRKLKFDFESLYGLYNLVFSPDLDHIYKDMYYMTKIGLQPSFIKGLTPLERTIFWSIYNDEQRQKNSKNKGSMI